MTADDSISRQIRPSLGRLLAVYALFAVPKVAKPLRKGYWQVLLLPNLQAGRIASFVAFLPLLYRLLSKLERKVNRALNPPPGGPDSHLATTSKRKSISPFAVALSSPLLALLPDDLRLYVSVFVATSAVFTLVRGPKLPAQAAKEGQRPAPPAKPLKRNNWTYYLPPAWTMFALSNAISLPLWLFGPDGTLPRTYDSTIANAGRFYYTTKSTPLAPLGIKHVLNNTVFNPVSAQSVSRHDFEVCEVLHPLQSSCTTNFGNALVSESVRVARWIVAFEALRVFRKGYRSDDGESFFGMLPEVVLETVRESVFIAGAVNSAWAATCVLQRVLPPGLFTQARFLLNGTLFATPWIALLSPKRRAAISLYAFRMTLCNVANYLSKTRGWTRLRVKQAQVALFALAWVWLSSLRRQNYRLEGTMAFALDMVEGH